MKKRTATPSPGSLLKDALLKAVPFVDKLLETISPKTCTNPATMNEKREREDAESLSGEGDGKHLFAISKVEEAPSEDESDEETLVRRENTREMDVILPRRKRFIPKYEVEGVAKIILGEETQMVIELCIGPDVNAQHPWKSVKKALILDSIEAYAELSEFFPFKEQLAAYDDEDVLMGYIVDESKDTDEFYICFTKEGRDHCKQQSDKFHRRQQQKLEKAVLKKPRPWVSLGSEVEIKELVPVNTRPLIEIEIKSRFPTVYQPEKFVPRDTTNVRDGYLELTPYRVKYNNVFRKRVDTAVQVAPGKISTEAQTELRYPKDVWTQSIADSLGGVAEDAEKAGAGGDTAEADAAKSDKSDDTESAVEEDKNDVSMEAYKNALKRMRRPSYIRQVNHFMSSRKDEMDSVIELNSVMDIYSNDYPKLIKKDVFGMYDTMKFNDYVCFTDVRAKDKYVSYAAFHPMWTGVVAIAYADGSPSVLKTPGHREDPIQRAVYGLNPVMIWSHIDSLIPKLYLESPREVKMLSFCPFNENILLGGCVNGQVVIWDITNKLEKAEEIEVLSETREKYRIAINSQMGWMKNVHDKSIITSTVLSLLLHSHYGPVTAIRWLSPNFTITTTGRKKLLEEDQPRSLIFFTSSEDGTIRIWNLSLENVTAIEGKKVKKSKRVPRRPSALTLDVSPLKVLDRTLQPIFKIIIGKVGATETIAIQDINGISAPPVKYVHVAKKSGSGRKYFTCQLLKETEEDNSQTIYCGSMYGDVMKLSWEGHDFNTGEVVNSEFCNMSYRSLLHDGIVTATVQNPFIKKIILSVGGKIFALWSDEINDRPLLWKKRRCRLTDAAWSQYKPSLLFVTTSEGNLESWDLLLRSDEPIAVQTLSGGMLTLVHIHTLPLAQNIIGVSDINGSFRMFLNPPIFMLESPTYLDRMQALLKRETEVQIAFRKWQSNWTAQNSHIIDQIRRKEVALQAEKDEKRRKELEEEEKIKEEEAEALRLLKMRVITPEERWRGLINKLIEKTIAVKKRIDRVELLQQERPLRELEAQRLEKEKKMLEIMKNQKQIFNETVAILFPEAVEKKKPTSSTLIPAAERAQLRSIYLEDYDILLKSSAITVKENPYRFQFEWQTTLSEGLERRQALDSQGIFFRRHKERLQRESGEASSHPRRRYSHRS